MQDKNKQLISAGTVGYKGTVEVTLKNDNDVVLCKKVFHNKGYKTLFRFLCECLAGDYIDADKFRPLKIRVFNFNGTPQEARSNFEANNFSSNVTALSGSIVSDTRAKVIEDANGYSVIFHFTIPFAYLNNLAEEINLMMLYPSTLGSEIEMSKQNMSKQNGLLAYYLCTKKNDSNIEVWDPIKLSEFENKENTNLIIEWKMSILNID